VETFVATCPGTAPDEGPYLFPTYADMQRGEVGLQEQRPQTIQPTGSQFGPELSQPKATSCSTVDSTDNPATANYRVAAAPAGGYTVAGPATVIARLQVTGASDQVAARLLDVGPGGQEQLIERGLYRPQLDPKGTEQQVFQLQPNVVHIAEGHVLKLELLPDDAPYSIANPTSPAAAAQHPIEVSHLSLQIPVMEAPGTNKAKGEEKAARIEKPSPKFLPRGYELARDFAKRR
jgi:hypothetical protein